MSNHMSNHKSLVVHDSVTTITLFPSQKCNDEAEKLLNTGDIISKTKEHGAVRTKSQNDSMAPPDKYINGPCELEISTGVYTNSVGSIIEQRLMHKSRVGYIDIRLGTASSGSATASSPSKSPPKSQLETIGEGAFDGCSRLTKITIPPEVTTIGVCAFLDCNSLTSVTFWFWF